MTDITTVYSSQFDNYYQQFKQDRGNPKYDRLRDITRIVVAGGRFCDPPCLELPVFEGPVILKAEPDNKVDPNAIIVFYRDLPVGYVVRERTHTIHETEWRQEASWDVLPKLVNSAYGLYVVGV